MSLRNRVLLTLLGALLILLIPTGALILREANALASAAGERALILELILIAESGEYQMLTEIAQRHQGSAFAFGPAQVEWTLPPPAPLPPELRTHVLLDQPYRQVDEGLLWLALPAADGGFGVVVPVRYLGGQVDPVPLLIVATGSLVLAWGAGAFAFARILASVFNLRDQIATRGPQDLAPLPPAQLPEFAPLVEAVNQLLANLAQAWTTLTHQSQMAHHFAYGASHELRNPLAAVRGYLEVLQRSPGHTQALAGALRETERIEKIVNALLQLARLEGLGRAVGKPVELKTFIESNFAVPVKGQGQVWADPNLLQLALQNLIGNAQTHGKSNPSIELEAYGKGVWIWVHDQGPGFAPELLPEAFIPFKKTGSGTGLGLALVAEVASVHGGKVKAQNQPSGGAQVGIWLPSA